MERFNNKSLTVIHMFHTGNFPIPDRDEFLRAHAEPLTLDEIRNRSLEKALKGVLSGTTYKRLPETRQMVTVAYRVSE